MVDTKTNKRHPTQPELALIELLADPYDTRSKDEKSKAVGFAPKTVYSKMKQPHFVRALTIRCDERVEELKRDARPQVIRALIDRSSGRRTDDVDANRAAELVLKVTGDIGGGPTIINKVTANSGTSEGSTLCERLDSVAKRRARVLSGDKE